VMEVNGHRPPNPIVCNRLLASAADRSPSLVVARGAERRTLNVRLMPLQDLVRQKLGVTLLEGSPQAAKRAGVPGEDGLYIEEVDKNGPADLARLQRGYVVAAIEGQKTTSLRSLAVVLAEAKRGDTVNLTVVVPRRLGSSFVEFRQGTVEVQVR
jgi:predicted metalloprotease with PDZ domain